MYIPSGNSEVDEVELLNKFSPQSPPLLVKNHIGELHKIVQEVQLNDDIVTDELLIFALPTFEEEQAG